MRRLLLLAAAALLLLGAAGPAAAHKASDAYLRLAVGADGGVEGSLDVALRDLELAVGLDGDGDGAITWGELKARRPAVEAYALSRLALTAAGGAPCALRPDPGGLLVDGHADGAYAVLRLAGACPPGAAAGGAPTLAYRLLFDLDPTHRGLLTATDAAGRAAATAVLSPERPEAALPAPGGAGEEEEGPVATLRRFFGLGVEHIAYGPDHLLFLLVLLLPSVLRRREGGTGWTPVPGRAAAALDVAKVLTAFTLAHALSLTAAVLGRAELPARPVEAAIAATVALTALDNLRPFLPGPRWALAFGFGLVHGLGFAAALGPMGLPPAGLALALLGFNLGVEAAQLALALLYLGAAHPLRGFALYARGVLPAGSAAALAMAALWLADRALGLRLPAPF